MKLLPTIRLIAPEYMEEYLVQKIIPAMGHEAQLVTLPREGDSHDNE